MTIEDFRKLKTGDKVIVWNRIYTVSVGWNLYRVPFTEFLMNNKSVYRIYDKESCGIISVYENGGNFPERFEYNRFKFLNDMEHYDEKKYLESQLKEAEEQVQKETARVDSIKAKIEELTKPKLKIGGLYSFNYGYGKLVGVLYDDSDFRYSFLTSNNFCRVVLDYTNGLKWEELKFKEITNPKYSYLGKYLLEYSKLNPENFR